MSKPKKINIFGVTGSIGKSTVDVILQHADKFDVGVITAHRNADELVKLAQLLKADHAVLSDESGYGVLKAGLAGNDVTSYAGREALIEASCVPADISMMAIVGMAGLEPLWNAIEHSKQVAIANKEPLVAAGPLVMAKAQEYGCKILPVDSEHNAIFQVFEENNRKAIERIILTASGGPFRTWAKEKMYKASVKDALSHPNWDMGAKISIDSATMMNKALEVIEAHYLFEMPDSSIDVIIHPQSIIHSMVEYNDGSVLAQLGASDMRTPIANILSYPDRLKTPGNKLNLKNISALEFVEVDDEKFPFVNMAYSVLKKGLPYSICFNASNEAAVDAFLNNRIYFGDIMNCVDHSLQCVNSQDVGDLHDIIELDKKMRRNTEEYIQGLTK